MANLNCELPAVPRFSVSQDESGTACVVPDPKGRFQLKEAQEIADLQNGVYRVYAGKVFLGHVKYAKPKTGGPSVAYTAAEPEVGKEFSSLEQAIGWLREGKPQS